MPSFHAGPQRPAAQPATDAPAKTKSAGASSERKAHKTLSASPVRAAAGDRPLAQGQAADWFVQSAFK